METILKTFLHPDGKRRVRIVQRPNGLFGYELELLSAVDDGEQCNHRQDTDWERPGQHPFSVCDTPETAEREARGRIDWLRELP